VPLRGNHTRGIFVSAYTRYQGTIEEAQELYRSYYEEHPFVVMSEINPSMKQVVNTNKAILYLEKHKDKLVIVSVTDNLIKGASGQAIQNMNLMCGLDERSGLQLKPVGF
jgi:N-acetyl-gamma-glutamyl-phosphate reductase